MTKKAKIIMWAAIAAVILAIAIIGGTIMFGGHYVNIRGQHLTEYEFSSGGGMTGGYYRETVKEYDDTHALIRTERAEWHSQDPEVKEYLVDASILNELEGVIRRYRMNFWNRKTFTNEFICDGETDSYYFTFTDDSVNFSSQIYPLRYRSKLAKFDEIIKKYMDSAEKLPGLVNPRTEDEENYFLPEGKMELYVCSCDSEYLRIKVLNGTDDEYNFTRSYKLFNADTDELVAENEGDYSTTVYGQYREEFSLILKNRLEAGNYKLIVDGYELFFEIR